MTHFYLFKINFYVPNFPLQLFRCFNRLGICQSLSAIRRHVDRFSKEPDKMMMQWKQALVIAFFHFIGNLLCTKQKEFNIIWISKCSLQLRYQSLFLFSWQEPYSDGCHTDEVTVSKPTSTGPTPPTSAPLPSTSTGGPTTMEISSIAPADDDCDGLGRVVVNGNDDDDDDWEDVSVSVMTELQTQNKSWT